MLNKVRYNSCTYFGLEWIKTSKISICVHWIPLYYPVFTLKVMEDSNNFLTVVSKLENKWFYYSCESICFLSYKSWKLTNIQMMIQKSFIRISDQYSLHFLHFWRLESSSPLERYCQIIESTCPNFLLLTAQWWYFILKASFEYWVPMGLSMICVCSSLFLPNVEGAKYLTRIDVLVPKTFCRVGCNIQRKDWNLKK